jgi:hypothetical protein
VKDVVVITEQGRHLVPLRMDTGKPLTFHEFCEAAITNGVVYRHGRFLCYIPANKIVLIQGDESSSS